MDRINNEPRAEIQVGHRVHASEHNIPGRHNGRSQATTDPVHSTEVVKC